MSKPIEPTGRQLETPMRVGVTGHRSNRLDGADLPMLRDRIRCVLATLIQCAGGPGVVVSSLADGADQIVAREAIDQGYTLVVSLPFARAEYERDFLDPRDLQTYRELLARASSATELPGDRVNGLSREHAYAGAGEWMVDNSDILIAVWDGKRARGKGGTAEIVSLAQATGVPVIRLTATPPHEVSVLPPAHANRPRSSELADAIRQRFEPDQLHIST